MKNVLLFALLSTAPVWAASPWAYTTGNPSKPAEVDVYNWQTQAAVATITVGGNSISNVAVNPNGKFAYFVYSLNSATSLAVIDTSSNKIVRTVSYPNTGFNSVSVSPDGKTIWVSQRDGSVGVVCAITYVMLAQLKLPNPNNGFPEAVQVLFSPNGQLAYVLTSDAYYPGVSVFSTATRKLTHAVNFGNYQDQAVGMSITPDGKFLYISAGAALRVLSTQTYSVGDTIIAWGGGPYPPSITPDGAYLWVGATGDIGTPGGTFVIETATNNVIKKPAVSGIWFSFTPDGKDVYATGGPNTEVIRLSDATIVKTLPLSGGPVAFLPWTSTP